MRYCYRKARVYFTAHSPKRYFSITMPAIGAAFVPPNPAFSNITAIAIFGDQTEQNRHTMHDLYRADFARFLFFRLRRHRRYVPSRLCLLVLSTTRRMPSRIILKHIAFKPHWNLTMIDNVDSIRAFIADRNSLRVVEGAYRRLLKLRHTVPSAMARHRSHLDRCRD